MKILLWILVIYYGFMTIASIGTSLEGTFFGKIYTSLTLAIPIVLSLFILQNLC